MGMISRLDLEKHFTLPNEKISHLNPSEMPFDFVNRNSKKLLVTIGDSWTWGDELPNRVESCWGNILSERIKADWLNLSVSGAGNHYIGQLYQDFISYIKDRNTYENILCVVMLSETGKDFNGWFDRDVDYASWLKNNIKKHDDYYKLLEFINDFSIDRILTNKVENLELLCGFNFVNPSSVTKLANSLIKKTWLEVCINQELLDSCYIVSRYIFKKLDSIFSIEWSLDRQLYTKWKTTQLESTTKRRKILQDTRYFYPRFHPREDGHVVWAEHLYKEIKEKGFKIVKK